MSETKRWSTRSRRTIFSVVGLLLVVGLAYGGFSFFSNRNQSALPRLNYSLATPQRGPLSATVNASGTMQPRELVHLSFGSAGAVTEVLVGVGDKVAKHAPLARLDTRDLELRVKQAEAMLTQARAHYEKLRTGATPQEVAAARAQVEQARAQLQRTQGDVTPQDLAAARAQLEQARAALARLEAGPKTTDVQQAQADTDAARANLQSQRDTLSATKTRAESQLEQAANILRDRQDDYSRIYWNNRQLESQFNRFGKELPQENKDQEEAAQRTVQRAEEDVRQARVALEQTKQAERSGIEAAEAQLRSAQARLDNLLAGTDTDQLAAARAQVAQAEANLNRLQGDQRAGSIGAASASVSNAQANLERLTAGSPPADLIQAEARVQDADAALQQARLALEKGLLIAPIDGTVAEVNLKPGELLNTARPAIVLADLSGFHVDVTVDEIDVAQIGPNQPVKLTLDALPGLILTGSVAKIDPLSTQQAAVTSYKVRIDTQASDQRVRSGMSANADIVVAEKVDILMVPRRAVRADRGQLFVDLVKDQTLCQSDRSTWPVKPELIPAVVTTGLSNDVFIEITSGEINETTCLHVEGLDARIDPLRGPPQRNQRP